MLTRPSLLLNPWAVKETSNQAQNAKAGQKFDKKGNDADGLKRQFESQKQSKIGTSDFANLDFLGDGSVVLLNLRPNKAGVIEVDRTKLGPNQHIRVVGVNGLNTLQRNINLGLQKLEARDRRLTLSLIHI